MKVEVTYTTPEGNTRVFTVSEDEIEAMTKAKSHLRQVITHLNKIPQRILDMDRVEWIARDCKNALRGAILAMEQLSGQRVYTLPEEQEQWKPYITDREDKP